MSPNRLVLFDIDGTILWGGPLWKECFLGALAQSFPDLDFPLVPFGGKTDIQIAREILSAAGFSDERIDASMKQVVDLYVARAEQASRDRAREVTLLPGARELIEDLAGRPQVLLGLLTGNVAKGARAKLACVGLDHHFKFGVYGDDHWDRYRLPRLAIERARELFRHGFAGKQVVIIGDTVHDVNCGKTLGARSIAVGTGRGVAAEELLAQQPDYYFKDLSDTFGVVQAILEERRD